MSDDVKPEQSEEIKPAAEKKPTKKVYQKKWFRILAGVVIAIAVLIFVAFRATSGAVKASNEFLDAIQAGKSSEAYALFAKEVKDEVTQEQFDQVVAQISPVLNTQEEIFDRSIEANSGEATTGKVVYKLHGTDEKHYVVAVELIKEDGEWRVQNFDSDEEEDAHSEDSHAEDTDHKE